MHINKELKNHVKLTQFHKFSISDDLVKKWTSFLLSKEYFIMKLPSYQFKKFPNSTANRLHKYNLMKHHYNFINKTKSIISNHSSLFLLKKKKYITAWGNILTYKQKMGEHTHDEDTDKVLSGIIFLSKGSQFVFSKRNKSQEQAITPIAGLGILFPSSWKHYVKPHNFFSKRISIAFDIRNNKKTNLWMSL